VKERQMVKNWIGMMTLVAALVAGVDAGAQTRRGGAAGRAESQLVDLERREAKFRESLGCLNPAIEDAKRILADGDTVIAGAYRDLSAKFDTIRSQRAAVTAASAAIVKAVNHALKDFDATLDLQQRELERRAR
jgi:fructose-1-phosphate kinase PfkB-like protein